jgi:hypothetical protein
MDYAFYHHLCFHNISLGSTNTTHIRYGVRSILGFRYGYLGLTPGQADPLVLTPEVRRIMISHSLTHSY